MPDKQKVNCTAGAREAGLGHAVLSASSSHRWLECPPSALLCSKAGDTASEFAMQGTDAHSLCEYKLKTALDRSQKTLRRICSISMRKWQTAPICMPGM